MLKKTSLGLLASIVAICLLSSCQTIARGAQAEELVSSIPRNAEWGWTSGPAATEFDEAGFHPFDSFNPTVPIQVEGSISAVAVVDGKKQVVADLVPYGKKLYLAFPIANPPGKKEATFVEVKVIPGIIEYVPDSSGKPKTVLSSKAAINYLGEQLLMIDAPGRTFSIRSKTVGALQSEVTLRFPGKDVEVRVAYFERTNSRYESLNVPLKVISMSVPGEINWYYVLRADCRVSVDTQGEGKTAGKTGSIRVLYPQGQDNLKAFAAEVPGAPSAPITYVESTVQKMRDLGAFNSLKASDTPLP